MNAIPQPPTEQAVRQSRSVEDIVAGRATADGDGVKLTRVFGQSLHRRLDPFLMLDAFKSDTPRDYIAGFPAHPHRGFETITYMLAGRMRHQDSAGNEGLLESGGLQWMLAGRGVIHSEMPEQDQGLLEGFQPLAESAGPRQADQPGLSGLFRQPDTGIPHQRGRSGACVDGGESWRAGRRATTGDDAAVSRYPPAGRRQPCRDPARRSSRRPLRLPGRPSCDWRRIEFRTTGDSGPLDRSRWRHPGSPPGKRCVADRGPAAGRAHRTTRPFCHEHSRSNQTGDCRLPGGTTGLRGPTHPWVNAGSWAHCESWGTAGAVRMLEGGRLQHCPTAIRPTVRPTSPSHSDQDGRPVAGPAASETVARRPGWADR